MISIVITSRGCVIRFGGLLQVLLIFTRYFDSTIFGLFDTILAAVVEECANADLASGAK